MVSRSSDDIDDSCIGGNASAEVLSEGTLTSTVSGIDIVLNHDLREVAAMDKKTYVGYIKKYLKA